MEYLEIYKTYLRVWLTCLFFLLSTCEPSDLSLGRGPDPQVGNPCLKGSQSFMTKSKTSITTTHK